MTREVHIKVLQNATVNRKLHSYHLEKTHQKLIKLFGTQCQSYLLMIYKKAYIPFQLAL